MCVGGGGGGGVVYTSTKFNARDPPCVCLMAGGGGGGWGWGWLCVCFVWASVRKPVRMCVCVRLHIRPNLHT